MPPGIPRVPNRRKLQGRRLDADTGRPSDEGRDHRGHENANGADEGWQLPAGVREVDPPQPRAVPDGAGRAERRTLPGRARAESAERDGADKQGRARVGLPVLPGERVGLVPRDGDLRRLPDDGAHRERAPDGDRRRHFCVQMHSHEREGVRAVQVQVAPRARSGRAQAAFQGGLVQGDRRSHAGFPSQLPATVILIIL